MKKVISDNWNCIVYDTESNTFEKFVKSTNSFEMDSVTIAEYDGLIITEFEVIDFKKGDVIMISRDVSHEPTKKVFVCSDPVLRYDLVNWAKKENVKEARTIQDEII